MRQLGGLFQRRDDSESATDSGPATVGTGRAFDLNIEKVLEHWGPAEAMREIIANALDEQLLSETRDPDVFWQQDGWHVRDWGRGLRYEHLTQNENQEKLDRSDDVIGKFGVGLKDALAACDRYGIHISIMSRYGRITTVSAQKHGFEDITTLHAWVEPSGSPAMEGTDVCLSGISDVDVRVAKQFFLRYSGDTILETTKAGQVIQCPAAGDARPKIYVNGLRVAEEPNFLFSYNITAPSKRLLRAMNRERSNVGRTAYADRVKAILLESRSQPVMDSIARDMEQITYGRNREEVGWVDITAHAVRVLNASEKVIFVTSDQLMASPDSITLAREDGYRPIVVNSVVADKVRGQVDFNQQPVRDLGVYVQEWNRSFEYSFVDPDQLKPSERVIWDLTPRILELAGGRPSNVKEIRISTTMRIGYGSDASGVWEALHGRIVIKRDQLRSLQTFAGTLLHEIAHARTNASDQSFAFEQGLTQMLGIVVSGLLEGGT